MLDQNILYLLIFNKNIQTYFINLRFSQYGYQFRAVKILSVKICLFITKRNLNLL